VRQSFLVSNSELESVAEPCVWLSRPWVLEIEDSLQLRSVSMTDRASVIGYTTCKLYSKWL